MQANTNTVKWPKKAAGALTAIQPTNKAPAALKPYLTKGEISCLAGSIGAVSSTFFGGAAAT